MNIENIFAHNKKWADEKQAEDPDYFKKLSAGQKPQILYIGCSDSRITAEEIMGAGPGDIFVQRNIANLVGYDLSSVSVITYAVNHLKVKDIIVCGHYNCGGIEAAMASENLGLLNPWLRHIRDVYRLHKDELNAIGNKEKRYKRLVELNVQEQCINVIKNYEVQRAYREWGLRVRGWVFDIHTGLLVDLKIDFKTVLQDLTEIYSLD